MKLNFTPFKRLVFYLVFFFTNIIFSEFIVRVYTLGLKTGFSVYIVLFAVSLALLLAISCSAFSKKAGRIICFVLTSILFLIYAVQLVYYRFCDSFMSVVQLGMGGDALTNFGEAALIKIGESLLGIILLAVPLIALIILTKKDKAETQRLPVPLVIAQIILFVALHFGAVACLPLAGTELYSPYDIYKNSFVLSMSEKEFGVLTTLRLEFRNLFFGSEQNEIIDTPAINPDDIPELDDNPEQDNQPQQIVYKDNVTDIDFEKLISEETDADIIELHNYFKNRIPSKQNEYTGMFKDYNLILLVAESFSPYLLDEERTPTLYKMATEGFIFNDYYSTVCDNTSNGEYAILTGMLPDASLYNKGWWAFYEYNSFTASKNNLLPFCIGNQYKDKGYGAYAFHYYNHNYYGRNKTHPNLGYEFFAMNQGFKKNGHWPTSDLDMMKQSVSKFLTPDENGNINPFHAYFLTFSGHMPYNFGNNDMAIKNKSFVSDLEYSTAVKAYIAGSQELEYALQYLLQELEEAGELDNTLIALACDHYPYSLGLKKLSELAGKELDNYYDKYRSSFILWSASMQEPIEVDVPCCSLDILPTLSNLLGLEYDSRLLLGKDILSEGNHIAILADRSFVTDRIFYNCTNGEITLRDGITEISDSYVEYFQTEIKNKFTVSTKMLYNDYYNAVYGEKKE